MKNPFSRTLSLALSYYLPPTLLWFFAHDCGFIFDCFGPLILPRIACANGKYSLKFYKFGILFVVSRVAKLSLALGIMHCELSPGPSD